MEAYGEWVCSNPLLLQQPDKIRHLKRLQKNIRTPFVLKH
jgi:hypothetical protein